MMGFIPDRPESFIAQLRKRFNMELPEGVSIFYAEGIRVGHSTLRRSDIHGERGYGACDNSFIPTNAFIQNFGHLARRNCIELDEVEARQYAAGEGHPEGRRRQAALCGGEVQGAHAGDRPL